MFLNIGLPSRLGEVQVTLGARAQLETPPRRPGDPTDSFRRTGRRLLLERAGVEIGPVTAGFGPSTFYFTPSLSYTTAYASEQNTSLIAYRFRLPDQWTLAVAIEDGRRRRNEDSAWGASTGGLSIDPVVALRKRLPWGNLQVAGALHRIRTEGMTGCCSVAGRATGWAVSAGVEAYLETRIGSSELLVNLSASEGALDYLNASNYPADHAVAANGRVDMNRASAVVLSLAHYLGRTLRAVLSLSHLATSLDAARFRWRTASAVAQASMEYSPRRGTLAGLEVSWNRDRVGVDGSRSTRNSGLSAVFYVRIRFSWGFHGSRQA